MNLYVYILIVLCMTAVEWLHALLLFALANVIFYASDRSPYLLEWFEGGSKRTWTRREDARKQLQKVELFVIFIVLTLSMCATNTFFLIMLQ